MDLVVGIVMPIFCIVSSGWLAFRYRLIEPAGVRILNQYLVQIAVPPMLFLATMHVDFRTSVDPEFIISFVLVTIITMAIGILGFGKQLRGKGMERIIIALACGWGNSMYMGIPIAMYLFGEKGTIPVIFGALTTNLFFTLLLTLVSSIDRNKGHFPLKSLVTFLGNPVLLAPVGGVLCSAARIEIPEFILAFLQMLAPSAAPVALFALGGGLCSLKLSTVRDGVLWVSFVKLVISPLVAIVIILAMDLHGLWAASLVLMSLLPTGSMVYVFARQHDVRDTLASGAILVTTIASVFTISLVLPWLLEIGTKS